MNLRSSLSLRLSQQPVMTLEEIVDIIEAEKIVENVNPFINIKCTLCTDLMSEVLYFAKSGSILITTLATPYTVRAAHVAGVKVIVFTYTKELDNEIIVFARSKDMSILVTPLTTSTACERLWQRGLESCF